MYFVFTFLILHQRKYYKNKNIPIIEKKHSTCRKYEKIGLKKTKKNSFQTLGAIPEFDRIYFISLDQ